MRRLRFLLPAFAAAATAMILPTPSVAAPGCAGAGLQPTQANAVAVGNATLCLVNRQRARHGLPRLRQQRSLSHAANAYARLMVRQGFFDHVSPAGSTITQRIKRTNYLRGVRAWSIGENLAWGSGASATPAQIVSSWMRSAGHRRNILDASFREAGIGVAQGAPNRAAGATGATYVNEFGRRHR
jgi:uncharacterized protein YkwD